LELISAGGTSLLPVQASLGQASPFKMYETDIAGLELLYRKRLPKAQGQHGVDAVKFCNGYREEKEDIKLG
jgi:hypothetical protein